MNIQFQGNYKVIDHNTVTQDYKYYYLFITDWPLWKRGGRLTGEFYGRTEKAQGRLVGAINRNGLNRACFNSSCFPSWILVIFDLSVWNFFSWITVDSIALYNGFCRFIELFYSARFRIFLEAKLLIQRKVCSSSFFIFILSFLFLPTS